MLHYTSTSNNTNKRLKDICQGHLATVWSSPTWSESRSCQAEPWRPLQVQKSHLVLPSQHSGCLSSVSQLSRAPNSMAEWPPWWSEVRSPHQSYEKSRSQQGSEKYCMVKDTKGHKRLVLTEASTSNDYKVSIIKTKIWAKSRSVVKCIINLLNCSPLTSICIALVDSHAYATTVTHMLNVSITVNVSGSSM